jgi:glycosyltransferase involved in cell wall biosynthesis
MKILMVMPYFYPKIGGVENYTYNIAKGLVKKHKWDVIIVTSNYEGKEYIIENIEGLKVYRLPYWFKISNTPINLFWFKQITNICKKEKPDLVNGHTPVPFISDVAAQVAKKFDIPFILTYQNDLIKESKLLNFIILIYYHVLGYKTGDIAKKIITTSDYYSTISHFLKKYMHKVAIISPGVDINLYDSVKPKNALVQKYIDRKIVLFVGQLDKTHAHKGLHLLIEAVSNAKQNIKSIYLIVVGKGDMINEYKAIALKYGLKDNFEMITNADNKKLISYYKLANTVVLPSINKSEGFGMVLLEAGACKKSVIGSNIGGISYAIQNNKTGLLVTPGDINNLEHTITKLLLDKNLSTKLGEAGYSRIKSQFTWDSQIEKTYKLFQSL